jgi:hypothetical protein
MYQFTAARAEQHRADLMSAARQARDQRATRTARHRIPRLRIWRRPKAIAVADTPSVATMARARLDSRAV